MVDQQTISLPYTTHWKDIGMLLGMDGALLNEIDDRYSSNPNDCWEIVEMWSNENATQEKLMACIRLVSGSQVYTEVISQAAVPDDSSFSK